VKTSAANRLRQRKTGFTRLTVVGRKA
jgi:hypothetical protein